MAENLLQNGSFEQTINIGTDGFEPLQAGENGIDSWEIIKAPFELPVEVNTVYDIDIIAFIEGSSQFWGGSEGLQSVDLNGSPGYGGVEQTIATTPGQKYSVTFDMAGNPQSAEGQRIKELKVKALAEGLDVSEVFSFDTTGKTVENMGWEQKTWEFTATSEETILQFFTEVNEAEGINTDPYRGPALDNVVVLPILEFVEVQGTTGDDVLVGSDENIISPDQNPEEGEDTEETPDDEIPTNYSMLGENGDDILIGQDGTDSLDGGNNEDHIFGRQGNDTLVGGFGDDYLFGGINDDSLLGGAGADVLRGGNDLDTLNGEDGDDILIGGSGQDVLVGGVGKDILIGGNSPDIFRYNNALEGGDTIIDFVTNIETIEVSASGFSSDLIPGAELLPEQFVIGTAATDLAHRFIYDDLSGSLFFDGNGSDPGQQVLIAQFTRDIEGQIPVLTNENIEVIL